VRVLGIGPTRDRGRAARGCTGYGWINGDRVGVVATRVVDIEGHNRVSGVSRQRRWNILAAGVCGRWRRDHRDDLPIADSGLCGLQRLSLGRELIGGVGHHRTAGVAAGNCGRGIIKLR